MHLAVLTGILMLVVVQYAGVGNAGLAKIQSVCNSKYPAKSCGDGWFRFDAHRCIRVFRENKAHYEATWICRKQGSGGELVSIHNLTEYCNVLCLMVRDTTKRHPYWIGARRDLSGDRNKFKWADGKMMTFSRWYRWQPDNHWGSESCVEMNYGWWGRWNDENCRHKRYFVCVKKL